MRSWFGFFLIYHSSFCIGLFVRKKIQPLADDGQESLRIHLQLVGGNNRGVNFPDQQLVADLFGEGGMVLLEKAALAGDGFNHALALQFGVSLGDGVAVQPQFFGEGADGGQRLAGREGPEAAA